MANDSSFMIVVLIAFPFSQPNSTVVNPSIGVYPILLTINFPWMLLSLTLDLNVTFLRIHSAHSFAMAF